MRLVDRPWLAYVVILGGALVVASPALSATPRDSFPLSTYPMFSHGRKDSTVTVEHAVAIAPDGSEEAVPPRLVGSDEVLQARATLARAAKRGPAESKALCAAIAERARARGALTAARTIELRTTKLDAVAWFEAQGAGLALPAPLSVKRHATCPAKD